MVCPAIFYILDSSTKSHIENNEDCYERISTHLKKQTNHIDTQRNQTCAHLLPLGEEKAKENLDLEI